MEPFPLERAKKMLDAIGTLLDSTSLYINDYQPRTFLNAARNREIEHYRNPEIMRDAYSKGLLLLEVAADHLMGLKKMLTEPVMTFAPWVLLREVLEASAISAWLLDPRSTSDERARRIFAVRYEGLFESVKFFRSSKASDFQAKIDLQEKQIEAVENDAIRLGFKKLKDKNGKRYGIGMKMPSVTQLVEDIFNAAAIFRLLSGLKHCHDWALLSLSLTRTGVDDGMSEFVKFKKHISTDSVAWLSIKAVTTFVLPLWYISFQSGWDMDRLQDILESTYDSLFLPGSERFWLSTENTLSNPSGEVRHSPGEWH